MTKDTDYIAIGKIGSTYCVRGWLKIQSYTEFGASVLDYSPWILTNAQGEHKQVQIENSQRHGNGIIAKLAGINTPEDARLLTGKTISIERSRLPKLKEDEYYWSDLIGLTVINKNGEIYGKVIYLIATGSNDVLVIKGKDEKEHAIPYRFGDIIKNIDLDKKEIHVDWELL